MRRERATCIRLASLIFVWLAFRIQVATAQEATVSDPAATQADDAPRHTWFIAPRISVSETLTDNVLLLDSNKQADQITQISPGVRISAIEPRLKLYLDYQRSEFLYAQNSGANTYQNSLNSFGTLEAIEKWFFVDFSGIILQQPISAFGTQSPSYASINPNLTESSNYRVSPYIRGTLGSLATYEVRYSRSWMHAKADFVSDVDSEDWIARIGSRTALSKFGWSLEASQQRADYSLGRETDADRVRGVLSYEVLSDLRLSVIAGRETNNYISIDKESHNIHGFGFDWSPNERTKLAGFRETRFFGDGHSFTFTHRTPLSAWRFSDSRDVSILPNQLTLVGLGSMFDLIYQQFASVESDPVKRAALASNFLAANNISPNAAAIAGFLTSSAFVQRQRDLSFALIGARNTLTFLLSQSESQQLGTFSGFDSFSNASNIRQYGFTVTLDHRLSPLSSINLTLSRQRSTGSFSNPIGEENDTLHAFNITFTTKLGPHTTASLGARRAVFTGTISPYTEDAVVGTITVQF